MLHFKLKDYVPVIMKVTLSIFYFDQSRFVYVTHKL